MNSANVPPNVPLRRLALSLLTLCAIITAVVAWTVFGSHAEFPVWFCPIFLAGTGLLVAVIGVYAKALLHEHSGQTPSGRVQAWIWFTLIGSVLCTSSLHAFYPFRPDVPTVWSRLPPDLTFIHYNYVFTAASLLAVIGLAGLFFRGRQRLASSGLAVLAGIMLIPNDDCGNPFNAPWITWLGASPLMFLCNSVVLLMGYCALHGLWPRRSVLVMVVINVGVLSLGVGHSTGVVWGSRQAWLDRMERERHRPTTSLSRLPIQGHASFFICSDARLGFQEGLPVVICIGHTFQQPDTLLQFVGKVSEPVLLVWSDLLADLSADTSLEDGAVWERKRQEFATVLGRYREILRFDERRVYLTGFSFAGAYAWMLAYDRPELYAGVVPMSAMSYPEPIQQRLDSGKSVVTVVVRGEKDPLFRKQRDQEIRTGQALQARSPHSKFMLKRGEGHRDTAKYWVESLTYILQFKRESSSRSDAVPAPAEPSRSRLDP